MDHAYHCGQVVAQSYVECLIPLKQLLRSFAKKKKSTLLTSSEMCDML